MSIWVIVADAARARIFETQGVGARAVLTEVEDLVHPASRLHEQGLVSDRAGGARSAGGGVGHSVGHEHDATREEQDRFAREVAATLVDARRKGRVHRLHLLAAPRFLGALRAHLDAPTVAIVASEQALGVTGETPEQIRTRLPARL